MKRSHQTLSQLRNDHLFRAVRKILNDSSLKVDSLGQASELAANSPAPHFYVTYNYAQRTLSLIRRDRSTISQFKTETIRALWKALDREVRRIEIVHKIPMEQALVRALCDSPAPSFFLSPKTAIRIVSTINNRRLKSRKGPLK